MNLRNISDTYSTYSIVYMVAIGLSLNAMNAHAQVYKCQSGQKTTYSDKPCVASAQQTITDIDTNPSTTSNDALDTPAEERPDKINALNKQLASAVKSAIANGDLIRAAALASTDEQRGWVSQAQKEAKNNAQGRTEADLMAEKANSSACNSAKQALQQAADSASDNNEIAVKTSLMRAACGVNEPDPVIYGNSTPRFFGYPYHHSLPGYGSHLPSYPPQQNGSSNPADYPKPKPENFGSRFIRPEDGIPKYQ